MDSWPETAAHVSLSRARLRNLHKNASAIGLSETLGTPNGVPFLSVTRYWNHQRDRTLTFKSARKPEWDRAVEMGGIAILHYRTQ